VNQVTRASTTKAKNSTIEAAAVIYVAFPRIITIFPTRRCVKYLNTSAHNLIGTDQTGGIIFTTSHLACVGSRHNVPQFF
jgi:hypothetical protein